MQWKQIIADDKTGPSKQGPPSPSPAFAFLIRFFKFIFYLKKKKKSSVWRRCPPETSRSWDAYNPTQSGFEDLNDFSLLHVWGQARESNHRAMTDVGRSREI